MTTTHGRTGATWPGPSVPLCFGLPYLREGSRKFD
jgi:hypothetical protein